MPEQTYYRAWDREEKLGSPPWRRDAEAVVAWEAAHGHDVRLKCYAEFGCNFAEIEITDEMVERGTRASWAGPPAFDDLPSVIREGRARMVRRILEAALGQENDTTKEETPDGR